MGSSGHTPCLIILSCKSFDMAPPSSGLLTTTAIENRHPHVSLPPFFCNPPTKSSSIALSNRCFRLCLNFVAHRVNLRAKISNGYPVIIHAPKFQISSPSSLSLPLPSPPLKSAKPSACVSKISEFKHSRMAATLTSSIAAGSQSRVSLQLHERINPASVNINLMGELRREEDGMR